MSTLDAIRARAAAHEEETGTNVYAAETTDPDWLPLREAIRDAQRAIGTIERIAARRADRHASKIAGLLSDRRDEAMRVIQESHGFADSIYVVLRRDTNEVKIGISRNVPSRVAALQNASGAPLELLVSFPGDLATERDIHRRFSEHRRGGEWFTYAHEVRAWVEQQAMRGR